MKQCPKIYNLLSLVAQVNSTDTFRRVRAGRSSSTIIPARPVNLFSLRNRFKAAWLAFTGKADVVIWPEDQKGVQVE